MGMEVDWLKLALFPATHARYAALNSRKQRRSTMYPVRLGQQTAQNRIKQLIKNGHHAEALVTSVFTVEKMIRRTLKQLIVSAGFQSKFAERYIKNLRGIDSLKSNWPYFDPANRSLVDIIGQNDWQKLNGEDAAFGMRNKMVHGNRVYELKKCNNAAEDVLKVMKRINSSFKSTYDYDGWQAVSIRRKTMLHQDPKVKMP
jgi:hypothetical protein